MTSSDNGTRFTGRDIGLVSVDGRLEGVLRRSTDVLETRLRKHLFVANPRSLSRRKRPFERLLLISWAGDIDDAVCSRVRRAPSNWKGYLLFTGDLAPEALPARMAQLRIQDASRLSLVAARTQREAADYLRALVERLGQAEEERVLHAWVDRESLQILTTGFRVLDLPFEDVGELSESSPEERRRFEVGYDGTYLWWPGPDVHIAFDRLESVFSRDAALRRRQQSSDFNAHYGKAIRSVRKRSNLRQSDIEGLSERQLGRTERGEYRATIKTLDALARAHGLTTSQYMDIVAEALPEPYGPEP